MTKKKVNIEGMLTDRWKPFTKKEKEEFDKIIEEHKKEVEKRTGMSYEDWMQEIGDKLNIK